ncbi:MAG: archaellin/type IV pilin N-terminal domain-containing protein [Candidatus Woesearchaeota archaeon]
MLKRGKKGISPLVATVLLIAFAVSIGTLIMNLGRDVLANVGDCNDVKIEIQTINNKPLFCYDQNNNKINIMIKNTGSVDIKSLKLGITTEDFKYQEISIDDSNIKVGKTITKSIDINMNKNFKTEIIPIIIASGKETACMNNAVVAETTQYCN